MAENATPRLGQKRKRVRLTFEQKRQISEASFMPTFDRLKCAKEYGVSYNCVWDIVKNRHTILQQHDLAKKPKLTNRAPKFINEENALYFWFLKHHKKPRRTLNQK